MNGVRDTLVLPMLRKDFRRALPLWLAFTAVLALQNFVSLALMPIGLLLLALLVGWIPLEDPLHATLPFWRTRGLTPRQVGATKLAGVAVLAAFTLIAMQVLQWTLARLPGPVLGGMTLEASIMAMILILTLFALSTVSRDFSGFVPLTLGGFAILGVLLSWLARWPPIRPVLAAGEKASAWERLAAMSIPLGLAILAVEIARRGPRPGRVLTASILAWLAVMQVSRFGSGTQTRDAPLDAGVTWSARPLTARDVRGRNPDLDLNLLVEATNVPPAVSVQLAGVEGELRLDDGRLIPVRERSVDGSRSFSGSVLDEDADDGAIAFTTSILGLDAESERRMLDVPGDLHLRIIYRTSSALPADTLAVNTGRWLAPDLHLTYERTPSGLLRSTLVDWGTRGWTPDLAVRCSLRILGPTAREHIDLRNTGDSDEITFLGLLPMCWVERRTRHYSLQGSAPDWIDRAVLVATRHVESSDTSREVVVERTRLRDWVR